MQNFLYFAILSLGIASYAVGVHQMLHGKYAPSVFSRIVWLLLAINSFAGVVASDGSTASALLAGILLAGNATMCFVSFWKGSKKFGALEFFCLLLLVISGFVWLLLDAPLVNLGIGLFAHFIGALPTYSRVITKPESESIVFWLLFFAASVLSIFASNGSTFTSIIFPVYFACFDGSLFMLSLRKPTKS